MEQQAVLGKKIRYLDPRNGDYRDYFDHLIAYNETVRRAVSRGLQVGFRPEMPAAILTSGSDARLEKGPASLMEFVVLLDSPSDEPFIQQQLDGFIGQEGLSEFTDSHFEFKYVGGVETMSHCKINRGKINEINLTSPNRLFDAVFLAGNHPIFLEAKTLLEEEIRAPEGKDILDAISRRAREYRRVTTSGVQRYRGEDLTHFDLSAGVSHYDPEKHIWSFKQGPLRTVQFALSRDFIRTLRESGTNKIFFDVPTNTVGRINALGVEGFLAIGDQEARDLADSYKYFLQVYHIAQDAYRNRGEKTVGFDMGQVSERIRDIDTICAKRIVVPEQSLS